MLGKSYESGTGVISVVREGSNCDAAAGVLPRVSLTTLTWRDSIMMLPSAQPLFSENFGEISSPSCCSSTLQISLSSMKYLFS